MKTADQAATNQDPYAIVYLWPKSVLSLAKDKNNFGPHLNVKVTRDSHIRVVLRSSDIVPTLDNARAKEAVFVADHIDYRGLGDGEGNRDRRLVIQIDPNNLGARQAVGLLQPGQGAVDPRPGGGGRGARGAHRDLT